MGSTFKQDPEKSRHRISDWDKGRNREAEDQEEGVTSPCLVSL